MVEREGLLDAIDCHLTLRKNGSSVVDEHMQAIMLRFEVIGQFAHLSLGGEIGDEVVHRCCRSCGADRRRSPLSFAGRVRR